MDKLGNLFCWIGYWLRGRAIRKRLAKRLRGLRNV